MALVTTAATAAGSELRRIWALALALLLILMAVAWFLELGKSTRVVSDRPFTLPSVSASRAALDDAARVDENIQLTPSFTIEEPTTLEITLLRGQEEGWVSVDLALIEEDTGEIRQLGLATDVHEAVGVDVEAQRSSTVLIDRVAPGRYVVRIAPSWEALEQPAPGRREATSTDSPPTARLRIVEGRRSYTSLALAALLILLPPLFVTGRAAFSRSRA